MTDKELLLDLGNLTSGEREEMIKLGILSSENKIVAYELPKIHDNRPPIEKFAVHAPQVINRSL